MAQWMMLIFWSTTVGYITLTNDVGVKTWFVR